MDNIKITDASDREREGGREGEDLIVTILRAVKEEGSITRGLTRERIVKPNILYYHTHTITLSIYY